MRRRDSRFVLGLLLFAFARATGAESSSKQTAAEHFQRGLSFAKANEIDAAAAEFEAAYKASPNFAVLYNLGRTYSAMGRAVEAVDAFNRYLTEGGASIDTQRRDEVAANIALNERRIGEVDIQVEPAGSAVQIDGSDIQLTGHPTRLVTGSHALVARAPGHRPYVQAFTVVRATADSIHVRLIAETPAAIGAPETAWLQLSCPVPGVAVFVDDVPRGSTPLAVPVAVTAQPHHVVFERAGYTRTTVEWSPSSSPKVDCDLKPSGIAGQNTASLRLSVNEPGAEILIDDAPWTQSPLPFGPHHLELRKFGFERWAADINLKAGETKQLDITLTPERAHAEEHRRSIRTQRFTGYGLAGAGGVLVLTAGAVTLASSHAYDDWRHARDAAQHTPASAPNYQALQQDLTRQSIRVRTLDDWALSSAIAGGALLTTGVALLLTSESSKHYELPSARVTASGLSVDWQHPF